MRRFSTTLFQSLRWIPTKHAPGTSKRLVRCEVFTFAIKTTSFYIVPGNYIQITRGRKSVGYSLCSAFWKAKIPGSLDGGIL